MTRIRFGVYIGVSISLSIDLSNYLPRHLGGYQDDPFGAAEAWELVSGLSVCSLWINRVLLGFLSPEPSYYRDLKS